MEAGELVEVSVDIVDPEAMGMDIRTNAMVGVMAVAMEADIKMVVMAVATDKEVTEAGM